MMKSLQVLFALPLMVSNAPPPKQVFTDAIEGILPDITRYSLEGKFGGPKKEFKIELTYSRNQWRIAIYSLNTGITIKLQLGRRHTPLHLNGIVVHMTTTKSLPIVNVDIPFGDPMDQCFINGDSVYKTVTLSLDDKGLGSVTEREFVDCVPTYKTLSLSSDKDSAGFGRILD
jgi:hypothetical protein